MVCIFGRICVKSNKKYIKYALVLVLVLKYILEKVTYTLTIDR